MEKLGIAPGYLISQLINFGLLATLLYLLLYKPVLRVLHERQERVARSMADADAARESAGRAQLEYDRRMADAQRKAQEVIGQAAQAAGKVAADIRAEAERDADAIRQKAREDAVLEQERMLAQVQDQIAGLSMMATERVLQQAVDESLQRKLISQFIAEIGGREAESAAQDAGR